MTVAWPPTPVCRDGGGHDISLRGRWGVWCLGCSHFYGLKATWPPPRPDQRISP